MTFQLCRWLRAAWVLTLRYTSSKKCLLPCCFMARRMVCWMESRRELQDCPEHGHLAASDIIPAFLNTRTSWLRNGLRQKEKQRAAGTRTISASSLAMVPLVLSLPSEQQMDPKEKNPIQQYFKGLVCTRAGMKWASREERGFHHPGYWILLGFLVSFKIFEPGKIKTTIPMIPQRKLALASWLYIYICKAL